MLKARSWNLDTSWKLSSICWMLPREIQKPAPPWANENLVRLGGESPKSSKGLPIQVTKCQTLGIFNNSYCWKIWFRRCECDYPIVPIHILSASNFFWYFVTQPSIKDFPKGPRLLAQVELFATCGGMLGEHLEKVAGVQIVVVVHVAEPGLL